MVTDETTGRWSFTFSESLEPMERQAVRHTALPTTKPTILLLFNNFIINTVDTSSTGSVSSQIFFLPVILILDIVFFQSLLHLHLLPSLCLLPSSASNPPLNSSDKLVVYEISHLLSHHGSPPTLCNASDYPVLPVFCLFLCSIISQLLRRFVCMVPAMASMH